MTAPCALLLSGGMDSATCLWQLRETWPGPVHTVSIDYGQRHRIELEYARRLAARAGVERHEELGLALLSALGGSPLTDGALEVPDADELRQRATVVPFRNLLFVAACAAYAGGRRGIRDLFIAAVRDDHDAYRDCRREFYDSVEETLGLGAAEEGRYRIHTPLIGRWKTEVVAEGLRLRVPYGLTHTCYTGRRPGCGRCDACSERLAAFRANGVRDPLAYEFDADRTVSP
ncbi:MAG: 7-cyano-7-deazaguanine synthase QueC [Gemmatimonadetes bacterium]|nr:7-cyano-7-deazaguanine synthase QueC [Gemmatimonadota bacterium]